MDRPTPPAPTRKHGFNAAYLLFAVLAITFFQDLRAQYATVEPIPYNEFRAPLEAKRVQSIRVFPDRIEGRLSKPDHGRARSATRCSAPPRIAT